MNYDVEIAVLKTKIDALENESALLYESLEQRINDIYANNNQYFVIGGIIAAIIIGGIQIAITLLS